MDIFVGQATTMRTTVLILLLFVGTMTGLQAADAWGATGHRATGEIAQRLLSKKAQKAIAKILDGQSLAFVSTYGDEIKSDERYRSYSPWHYVNFPFGSTYAESEKSDQGDLVHGINMCLEVLKSTAATKQERQFHLKMLVHFIGDLHQPLHVGIAEDRGGNRRQVRWFDDGTNLHRVWDTTMIEFYGMSYTELADNVALLSKSQLESLQQGSITDWVMESRALCMDVYENTEIGEKLGYEYMYKYFNTVRDQLQKGGVRLAYILNEIYG